MFAFSLVGASIARPLLTLRTAQNLAHRIYFIVRLLLTINNPFVYGRPLVAPTGLCVHIRKILHLICVFFRKILCGKRGIKGITAVLVEFSEKFNILQARRVDEGTKQVDRKIEYMS